MGIIARAFALACLLSIVCLVQAEQGAGDVVARVVNLVKELRAKIIADGKAEQKAYDKYACWCEATSARKANDIHREMMTSKPSLRKFSRIKAGWRCALPRL